MESKSVTNIIPEVESRVEFGYLSYIALGFLEDYNKWKIELEEQLDGRDAVVIAGELNDYYQNKHRGKAFKLWIDKKTGILLQMEEYNDQNQATEYIKW